MSFRINVLILALLVSNLVLAAGTVTGGGGGGIKREGRYLTFGSAKVKIGPVSIKEVPGLELLKTVVRKIPLVSGYKGLLQSAIYPVGDRNYYKIEATDLDPKNKSELLSSYRALLSKYQEISNEIVLFGVTSGKETFLLPEFFQLNEIQQAAILFHESLWIINPKLSYSQVVDAEIKMEDFLKRKAPEYGYDQELFSVFNQLFDNKPLGLVAAAKDDYVSGRLSPYLDANGRLPFSWVFGDDNVYCVDYNPIDCIGVKFTRAQSHIANQMEKYPEIKFFQELFALMPDLKGKLKNPNFNRHLNYTGRDALNAAGVELWKNELEFRVQLKENDELVLSFQ